LATATEPLVFLQHIHPNKDLRDASSEAEAILQAYGVQSSMRRDVYDAVQDTAARIRALDLVLDPEDRRFVDKLLLQYARDGFNLSSD
jgi:Zn-dependent oligopeptidase